MEVRSWTFSVCNCECFTPCRANGSLQPSFQASFRPCFAIPASGSDQTRKGEETKPHEMHFGHMFAPRCWINFQPPRCGLACSWTAITIVAIPFMSHIIACGSHPTLSPWMIVNCCFGSKFHLIWGAHTPQL